MTDKTSPLYQTALRLMGRIAATRDVLTRLTHMAAADGRLDLALSLNGVMSSLDNGETEACAILRLLDAPHTSTTPEAAPQEQTGAH